MLQLQRYLDAGTGITSSSGIESSKPRSSGRRKRSKRLEELRRREHRRRTGTGQKGSYRGAVEGWMQRGTEQTHCSSTSGARLSRRRIKG